MTGFSVRAPDATRLWLCLFEGAVEHRIAMERQGSDHVATIAGVGPGQAYGFRADGPWAPEAGYWFDPSNLLVDPRAVLLDRPFVQDPRLALHGFDTAPLVPRAILPEPLPSRPLEPPRFAPGGLIYEINVRGFTMRHPDIPEHQRGTIGALAHPAILDHLRALHVGAVELMPIMAWIDERHLPPLGLRNIWGYNPVVPMALDPRLAPGGLVEVRATVDALHAAGIGVILDLVFNHSGETDVAGPILSLRGLDNRGYYAHAPDGRLINDTGTGNTLDFGNPAVRALALDSLRHCVTAFGVDGFRFDLATVLARGPGFDPDAPFFAELAACPLLADRILIAEPWDIGPGGYQLGNFPGNWLEWNDRYRDDVRRFWRGDGEAGVFATRLCGSADIFGGTRSRGVSFIAAHDGLTLADLVSHAERHNHANGEDNRDGHGENLSWNNGAEGATDDPEVLARRAADARALIATLFATRGTIQLTAGDEFGRSQQGNNNAYAQDNALGWVDWDGRDRALEAFAFDCARWRAAWPAIAGPDYLEDAEWHDLDGRLMTPALWHREGVAGFEMRIAGPEGKLALRVDRTARSVAWRIEPT